MNKFRVGDLVFHIDSKYKNSGELQLVVAVKGDIVVLGKYSRVGFNSCNLRHATKEEIKAGRRLI